METRKTLERIRNFKYILIFEGAVMGIIAGSLVSVFRILIDKAQMLRGSILGSPYIIPFYVICFLAVCMLLKWDRNSAGSGIPQVRAELLGRLETRWYSVLIAKIIGGAAAIGAGYLSDMKDRRSRSELWQPRECPGSLSACRWRSVR